jgi:hypothetical protein
LLSRQSAVPPATLAAGRLFDLSVAASSESHTAATQEQRRIQMLQEYNASLARLYRAVTPQQKRLKRLDAPGVDQQEVKRVVDESLAMRKSRDQRRAF